MSEGKEIGPSLAKRKLEQRGRRFATSVRAAMAVTLSGLARGLSSAAGAAESTARQLRPPQRRAAVRQRVPEGPGPVPTEPSGVPGTERARAPESHIVELADRTVREILARIHTLSTDELEQLYRYEQTHKNRKSVLQAIERSLSP